MRLFLIVLLLLGLATCASNLPHSETLVPAAPALAGLRHYQLVAPEQALHTQAPYPQHYSQLAVDLNRQLQALGYRPDGTPQLRVYYWLAVRDEPLEFRVDTPGLLGPYQSIHRLRDATGTLRVRLTDLQDHTLWEARVETGLSPQRSSATQLEQAVSALLQQIPVAR